MDFGTLIYNVACNTTVTADRPLLSRIMIIHFASISIIICSGKKCSGVRGRGKMRSDLSLFFLLDD